VRGWVAGSAPGPDPPGSSVTEGAEPSGVSYP
jgi:hypothetical protein